MTELHGAVTAGDVARVREILQRDPSRVNDRDADYRTPLHMIKNNVPANEKLRIMQILLDYGADVNDQCKSLAWTPLQYAVEREEFEVVKFLLENGADPNLRDRNNKVALHGASDPDSNSNCLKVLLAHGADINTVDSNGRTPLDIAIYYSNFNNALVLIDAGAKARDIFRTMEYFQGDNERRQKFIQFVKQHGAEMNLDGRFSMRALYFAGLRTNFSTIVKNLLNHIHCLEGNKDKIKGMTKLHVAVENKDEHQVQTLVKAGIDINAKNVIGKTALHIMLDHRYKKQEDNDQIYRIVRLLIEAGADLNARDCYGYTPFQNAAVMGYAKLVNYMVAKISGFKESLLCNDKVTQEIEVFCYCVRNSLIRNSYSLAIAIALGYEEVVDSLIDAGHHIEATKDLNFQPPIYFAVKRCRIRIAKMFLEIGCQAYEWNSYYVPYIDPKDCDNDHLELVGLLWEFDLTSIFKNPLLDIFQNIKKRLPTNALMALLIFYYKLGLHSNKFSEDFIQIRGYYCPDERLASIFASCDDRIEELKMDLVCGSLSKFDLLTMKLDSLVKFLNDENNCKACKKLRSSFGENVEIESSECAMKVRIDLAMEKKTLRDSAKDGLNNALRDVLGSLDLCSLPDEITYNILDRLNVRELRKMTTEK